MNRKTFFNKNIDWLFIAAGIDWSLPPFAGKNILFVGYLLQFPPVIPNSNAGAAQKLITKCSWWNCIKCYGLQENIRSLNKEWNRFLYNV